MITGFASGKKTTLEKTHQQKKKKKKGGAKSWAHTAPREFFFFAQGTKRKEKKRKKKGSFGPQKMGDVEEFEVKFLSPEQRKSIYDVIWQVNCLTPTKSGGTMGIDAEWLEHKLLALVEDRPYGETDPPGDGHLRPILSIFWTREAESSPVTAFAMVCAPSPDTGREHRFHRLRHEHVDSSVYLAILCGSGATKIMDHLVKRYADVVITLDSLTHVIPYYLRPEFGVARMIDTEATFRRSAAIQQEYTAAKTKEERIAVREKAVRLKSEILKAEEFTPLAECAVRGRADRGVEPDMSYVYAHIVILPAYLHGASFDQLCKPTTPSQPSPPSPPSLSSLPGLYTDSPSSGRKRIASLPMPRPKREPKIPNKYT